MTLEIYNSLTRTKENFKPVEPNKVKMYVCGMTVYSDAHIGHARTYLAFDIIRRYFEYKGYTVTYVQNITDVDDKIIAAANKENTDPLAYAQRFIDRCLSDMDKLGIRRADHYPRASTTIPDMITMIQHILDNGYGYQADGDVYFSVHRFPAYGQLSGQNIHEMKTGARIEPGEKKQHPLDFALWKQAKPGEPYWDSPWGKGRPGWHIECSTMSSNLLGLPFDIHGGGMDLRFPHHENEIAQAEAATHNKFANYWIHIGLLTINGDKMSKSLGNIINIRDLLTQWNPEIIRMFFAQNHYRSPPDFTEKTLLDVQKSLERIHRLDEKFTMYLQTHTTPSEKIFSTNEQEYDTTIDLLQQQFEDAMDDDFNTPKAFAHIFEFVNKSNRFFERETTPNPKLITKAQTTLQTIGNVLTLFQPQPKHKKDETAESLTHLQQLYTKFHSTPPPTTIPAVLDTLLALRETARKKKDWKTADTIRIEITNLGYEIQDTPQGPMWRKKE